MAQIKQEEWSYSPAEARCSRRRRSGIGLDGTCLLMGEDGWREAMVGTLAFFDKSEGDRQHTVYLAATPEYGKAKFLARIGGGDRAGPSSSSPRPATSGSPTVASGNWDFLGRHTSVQVVDLWHAAEYLGKAAVVLYRGQPQARKMWLDDACHRLKYEAGGAGWVLKRLRALGPGAAVGPGR